MDDASSSAKTSNPFALLLDFYHRYRRIALQTDSLLKVVKKYGKGSNKNNLIEDVQKKYQGLPLESSISMLYLNKLVVKYNVPESYFKLIENYNFDTLSNTYDEANDPCSVKFDAQLVLSSRNIILPVVGKSPFDNLTKCKHLVPGEIRGHALTCTCASCRKAATTTATTTTNNNNNNNPVTATSTAKGAQYLDDIMNYSIKCK
jgi:hypothetical protein